MAEPAADEFAEKPTPSYPKTDRSGPSPGSASPDNHSSRLQFANHGGMQNNNPGSGNQFIDATFNADVYFGEYR